MCIVTRTMYMDVKEQEAPTEFCTVGSSDAAPVNDASGRCDSGGDGCGKVGADVGVCLLGLCRGGDFAGADSPNGLVGDDDFAVEVGGWVREWFSGGNEGNERIRVRSSLVGQTSNRHP
jgi:hypothetical protein